MAEKITKNISLTRRLDNFIAKSVRSGRYQSASELVREGLRLLEDRDRALAETRSAIEAGWRDSEAGRTRDGQQFFKQLRSRIARTARAKR